MILMISLRLVALLSITHTTALYVGPSFLVHGLNLRKHGGQQVHMFTVDVLTEKGICDGKHRTNS